MEQDIIKFLLVAKKATYAGGGKETTPSRVNSHDLVYKEGELTYYDTYLGKNKFAGEEAVWIGDKPYWSMNYFGQVFGEHWNGDFFKAALSHVPENMPFRGPEYYTEGDYAYICDVEGNFECFTGEEVVTFKKKIIYRGHFHGGLLS